MRATAHVTVAAGAVSRSDRDALHATRGRFEPWRGRHAAALSGGGPVLFEKLRSDAEAAARQP